jgi:hypothetical protein
MTLADTIMTKADQLFLSKIKEHTKLLVDNTIYNLDINSLSWTQKNRVHGFVREVEPWLLDHIGDFGVDWFVEIDKDADSLRLTFKDQETETYFTLAWMHGAKNSDTDDVQS